MLRSLWLLSTVLAAEALASSGTIEAREAFELVLPDGGSSGTTALSFLLPLPGEDRAIVSDFDVGFVPVGNGYSFAIIKLGGPDAGVVLQHGIPSPFLGDPTLLFRVNESGTTNLWIRTDYQELGRLESDQVVMWPNVSPGPQFIGGEWQTVSQDGFLRISQENSEGISLIGVDSTGGGFRQVLVASRDGGVNRSLTPPGTDRYYATASTTPADVDTGDWYSPPSLQVGTLPVYLGASRSAVFSIGERLQIISPSADFPGAFVLLELSPTGASDKGTFVVSVDGGICGDIGCAAYMNAVAVQEPFPGYPQGALMITNYRVDPPYLFFQVVLVAWEDVATYFGLEVAAGPLPVGRFGGIPDGGPFRNGVPPGGEGNKDPGPGVGGPGIPMGPGIRTGGTASCATALAEPSVLLGGLVGLFLLARRRHGRNGSLRGV